MSKFLISEPPLVILPSLAKAIGLNEAIFLQQLHYWLTSSQHERDGRKWVYNTLEDWQQQFPFWSVMTIRRTITSLKYLDLISTTDTYNKMPMDKTTWYSINYDKVPGEEPVNTPSVQNEHMQVFKMDTPITREYKTDIKRVAVHEEQPTLFPAAETASSADAVPPPVALGSPKAEPPKTMTPHVAMMMVLSEVLLGHRDHAMWTSAQSKMLGSAAKKLLGLGWSFLEVDLWFRQEWPKHWAAKNGGRPNNNQLMEGLAQWKKEAIRQTVTVQSANDWSEDDE